MDRRGFLSISGKTALAVGAEHNLLCSKFAAQAQSAAGSEAAVLPGSVALAGEEDLAAKMVDGIHRYLLARTETAAGERGSKWKRDYSSSAAYERSVSGNRARLQKILGVVDARVSGVAPEVDRAVLDSPVIAEGAGYKVYPVRWPVLESPVIEYEGLGAEGLLLQPEGTPVARIVAIPDADCTPEMLAGLAPGIVPQAQFARRLAENGCQVIVPVLVNRADTYSGVPGVAYTNQPHREWIYRMSFEVGRHVIGHEVQKVLAAVDWFERENWKQSVPVGVIGHGEGGLLALYSGALDHRIDATVVSGYFQERESLWKEPIYRDVWSLLCEFGDAEIASLIAPRALIVEASRGPEVDGPPPVTETHMQAACPNGKLTTPALESVRKEAERAREFYAGLKAEKKLQVVVSGEGHGEPGSESALGALLEVLGVKNKLRPEGPEPRDIRGNYNPQERQKRQFEQMVSYTQGLIHKSPEERKKFWAKANSAWPNEDALANSNDYIPYTRAPQAGVSQWSNSPEQWEAATKWYRDYIWEEVIGRLPTPTMPINARTRKVYDERTYTGYEVVLDVWEDVFAYGVLLLPKGMVPGERRPVVVCQHGLESRVQELVDMKIFEPGLRHYANRLAEEGFVVFAPQAPYRGEDHFRLIERMGHPVKLALYSFILGQHQRMLEWLAQQPFVDPDAIGFYGISYGGTTAVRVPPLLEQYKLSICSDNFTDWVWKTTNVDTRFSYLLTPEYEMHEFDFANVVNYAELANLMAPRPFMVERGHYDSVSSDARVAYEYAKVKWFYAYMGIPDRTTIVFENGPHMIYGTDTFEFLRKHLPWKPGRWSPISG